MLSARPMAHGPRRDEQRDRGVGVIAASRPKPAIGKSFETSAARIELGAGNS